MCKFVLMMMVVCSEESCELLEEMDHRNTFVLVFSSLHFCSFRVLGVLWILQQEPIGDLFPLLSFSFKRMIVSYHSLDFCFYQESQSNGRIK